MMRTLAACIVVVLMWPAAALAQQEVSWETLAQVKLTKQGDRFVPQFEEPVQELAGQVVQLKGFMMPLDQATKQAHFVLSANPVANCFFCMPGGPESLVEVRTDKGVEFSYDPIIISGRLELLEDDPMGMYYRLADAKVL